MELSTSEHDVKRDQFIYSFVHLFLKTTLALTDRRLVFERPNTLLSVIPIGMQKDTLPLRNIASVGTSTKIGVWRLLLGIVLAIVGLVQGFPNGLFAIVIGLFLIVSAFQAALKVTTNGGDKHVARIAITEKSKAQAFADQVNTTIAAREDGTTPREIMPVAV